MGLFGNKTKSGTSGPRVDDILPSYMTGAPVSAEEKAVNLSKAAKISLEKFPRLDRRWALYKASDISYSMDGYIHNGDLDYLTEAISTVSYENGWDSDNKVPVFPYGQNVARKPYVLQLGSHKGSGNKIVQHGNQQGVQRGGTRFVPPVEAIFNHYRNSEDWGQRPAIAFIQTDGLNSDMNTLATRLTDYSPYPIHWVFIYYGEVDTVHGRDNAANLRQLDDGRVMPNRSVDNVSVFIAGPQPKKVLPVELYEGLLTGPNQWVADAQAAGIL
jgi:vWA found in TerF C terminus